MCIARFTLAVDRRVKKDAEAKADFIRLVAFGKTAEFCEKYVWKGVKFVVEGRIQTGSYETEGHRTYTTDIVIEQIEFAESKGSSSTAKPKVDDDGFMNIPDGIDEELPFN